MAAIFKRELKSLMQNVTGEICITVLLLFTGICVTIYNLVIGYSSFQYAIQLTGIAFLVFIPIMTMRSLSEDRNNRTDKLLFSLPIKTSEIILGKFFAIVAVLAIPIAIMLLYPIILSAYGHMYYGASYSAVLALFLLGIALIAICMFISSLTESPLISALICVGVLLFLLMLPLMIALIPSSALASFIGFIILEALLAVLVWRLTKSSNIGVISAAVMIIPTCAVYYFKGTLFEGLLPKLLGYLSLYDRFYDLNSGNFDLKTVVFFVSVTVYFLFLCVQSLDRRRWN
ncbi:MAG: ABC transporter permease [Eubacteriales bacterium]|nr:ABC transporter permease [Eubacteriales bacterium]MDY4898679.1 ABC transporter permease [Eubacteriales bacterium]